MTFPPPIPLLLLCAATVSFAQHVEKPPLDFTEPNNSPKAEALMIDPSPLRIAKTSLHLETSVVESNSSFKGTDVRLEADTLASLAARYRPIGVPAGGKDGFEIALSVRQKVRIDPSRVLEIVSDETAANPSAACEIVKAAIEASQASTSGVVGIANAAIHAAPDAMRIISQCAIATVPDALPAVQALLAKLDPNGGVSSPDSKDSKGAVLPTLSDPNKPISPNPLDLPPLHVIPPPPIWPPAVSPADPEPPIVKIR